MPGSEVLHPPFNPEGAGSSRAAPHLLYEGESPNPSSVSPDNGSGGDLTEILEKLQGEKNSYVYDVEDGNTAGSSVSEPESEPKQSGPEPAPISLKNKMQSFLSQKFNGIKNTLLKGLNFSIFTIMTLIAIWGLCAKWPTKILKSNLR